MTSYFKNAASVGAAIALLAAGLTSAAPASADQVTPTLTYAEFTSSQGFQDLTALSALSQAAYATMQGLEVTSVVHAVLTVESTLDMKIDVKTNKTDSTSTTTVSPSQGLIAGTTSYYFSNGHYLFDAMNYQTATHLTGTNNLPDTLKRLGAPSNSVISTNLATPPAGFGDISPSAFVAQVGQNGLSSISVNKLNMLFSPVTCAAPAEAPDTKVCTYRASSSALGSIVTIYVDVSVTFDSTGFMSAMSVAESSDPAGLVFNLNVSLAPLNGWTQTLPSKVLPDTQVIAMGRQLDAETVSQSKANIVVAKAQAIAKKAKTTLEQTHLTQAAKMLKQKVSKIKGGVKISTAWQSVWGSACVVVAKGKASVKHC